MKKRIFCLLLTMLTLLSAVSFASCSAKEVKAPEGTVTRMTVDINPSVELMLDDQNKVVSVTALNDDGSILIVGEELVGKTAEEATELIVSLSCETGYLVKGSVTADENTVTISVSGDTEYAKYLASQVEKKVTDVLKKHDIQGKVEKAEALKLDALRALAAQSTLYTEEEINAMDEAALYRAIAAGRVETALLLTEELRTAYFKAKEAKISFASREETAKIIDSLGGLYQLAASGYHAALSAYSTAIEQLDNLRYQTLVSPDSDYQKSLASLREAKEELLKQRTITASLKVGSTEYLSATATLRISEENYNKALAAYENLGVLANQSFESLIAALRESEAALIELESHFPADIRDQLTAHAAETEAALNRVKDSFFENFEKAHKDDIEAIQSALLEQKKALMEQ